MVTITTKNQAKNRATTPPKEEQTLASTGYTGKSEGTGEPVPPPGHETPEDFGIGEGSSAPSGSAKGAEGSWTREENGQYSGPDGAKHYGDSQPKIDGYTYRDAARMIREADPSAKGIPDDPTGPFAVTSYMDTMPTYVSDVGGNRVVISGPLAPAIANARGVIVLTAGDANPIQTSEHQFVEPTVNIVGAPDVPNPQASQTSTTITPDPVKTPEFVDAPDAGKDEDKKKEKDK